eukprot:gene11507-12701_t
MHRTQIKLYQQPARISPPHSRPAQAKPQYSNTAYDLWGSIAHRRNCASINQSDPTAHSANEDLTPDQTDEPAIPSQPLLLAESHDREQPAQHETEPDITFCHPQQQMLAKERSKTGIPRKFGKNN